MSISGERSESDGCTGYASVLADELEREYGFHKVFAMRLAERFVAEITIRRRAKHYDLPAYLFDDKKIIMISTEIDA